MSWARKLCRILSIAKQHSDPHVEDMLFLYSQHEQSAMPTCLCCTTSKGMPQIQFQAGLAGEFLHKPLFKVQVFRDFRLSVLTEHEFLAQSSIA